MIQVQNFCKTDARTFPYFPLYRVKCTHVMSGNIFQKIPSMQYISKNLPPFITFPHVISQASGDFMK